MAFDTFEYPSGRRQLDVVHEVDELKQVYSLSVVRERNPGNRSAINGMLNALNLENENTVVDGPQIQLPIDEVTEEKLYFLDESQLKRLAGTVLTIADKLLISVGNSGQDPVISNIIVTNGAVQGLIAKVDGRLLCVFSDKGQKVAVKFAMLHPGESIAEEPAPEIPPEDVET